MRQDRGKRWVPFRPHEEARPRTGSNLAAAVEAVHQYHSAASELEVHGRYPEEIYDLAIDAFGLFRFDDAMRLFADAYAAAEREIASTDHPVRVATLEALQLDVRINRIAMKTWRSDLNDRRTVATLGRQMRALIDEERARERLVEGESPGEVFASIPVSLHKQSSVIARAERKVRPHDAQLSRAFAALGYFYVIQRPHRDEPVSHNERLTKKERDTRDAHTRQAFDEAVKRSPEAVGVRGRPLFTEDPSLLYSWAHARLELGDVEPALELDFNRAEAIFNAQAQKLADELRMVNSYWIAAREREGKSGLRRLNPFRRRNAARAPNAGRLQSSAELETRAVRLSARLEIYDHAARMIGSQGRKVHEASVAQIEIATIMTDLERAETEGLGQLAQVAQGLLQKLPAPDPLRPSTESALIEYQFKVADFARERLCAAAFQSEADRAKFGEAAAYFARTAADLLYRRAASGRDFGDILAMTSAFEHYDDAFRLTGSATDHAQALTLHKVVGDMLDYMDQHGFTSGMTGEMNGARETVNTRVVTRDYPRLQKHAERSWNAGGRVR